MPARKRTFEEVDNGSSSDSIPEVSAELSTLQRIRGMWEFAAFMQYLWFFGKAVKVEDVDVEDFEDECLKPTSSDKLDAIALALLKNVSSHKGLTPDLLDEYTRRQYVTKAPKRNPFGEEDEPRKFSEFDIFTKIRVLNQLATWTLHNSTPIREKLGNLKESDEVEWRIEPFGWDKEDRVYFVLDDNRLYRRTDAPPLPEIVAPVTPKQSKAKGRKSNGRNTRSAKKPRIGRRIIETSPEETEEEEHQGNGTAEDKDDQDMDDFCMQRWELLAVSMDEYQDFCDSLKKSRDGNERAMVKRIQEGVMPVLAEAEEERKRKEVRRMKELEMLQKMATSKRSSRLADKQDKIKAEREAAEAEAARRAELEMAHREQRRQQQMEEARESRRETREQRLKEREVKRILEQERLEKEQEMLAKMETEGVLIDAERGRISERQLKADMAKRKRDLENLQADESWYFDCVCGVHGNNIDDGSHSIACETCNTWQHSKCNGISEQQAERHDFHFECKDCKKKRENPQQKIKLKFGSSPQATSAQPKKPAAGVHNPSKGQGKSPKAPRTNGAAGMVYPGPPPAAPHANGQPNGAPHQFQWHQYQPPQQAYQAYPSYSAYPPRPSSHGGPSSPPTTFSHQTPATYAQSYSPPRQPATYAPRPTSQHSNGTSPRPAQGTFQAGPHQSQRPPSSGYQQQAPHPPGTSYQQQVPRPTSSHRPQQGSTSQSPPSPLPHPPASYKPPNTLPPLNASVPPQPGSPNKRPVSSGFGPIIPPPLIGKPAGQPEVNGPPHTNPPPQTVGPISSHAPPQASQQARPTSSHNLPPLPMIANTTPAPLPRAPAFTPNSSFSFSHAGQGQTPFNAAPGYSPTKQPSPKVGAPASSPHPPAASPRAPATGATRFEAPKGVLDSGISPVKHDVPPSSPPQVVAAAAQVHGTIDGLDPAPAKELVNPVQSAPQILPSPAIAVPLVDQHGRDTNGT